MKELFHHKLFNYFATEIQKTLSVEVPGWKSLRAG